MKNIDDTGKTVYTLEEIEACIPILEFLVRHSEKLAHLTQAQRISLLTAAGRISRPDREEIKKRNKDATQTRREAVVRRDRIARAATGIRKARNAAAFKAPAQLPEAPSAASEGAPPEKPELSSPRNCYICKAEYTRVHFFYDAMCPDCAKLNYQKRFQTAPLHGKIGLITGARVKIGYQTTLMMLRAGATVIATTRFPVDAAIRFSSEEGFCEWGGRLRIYGLDLRHTPSVDIFARYIEQHYERLDILINNAAQTVRRPPLFYTHLMANENLKPQALPGPAKSLLAEHEACKEQLNAFCANHPSTESALPVSWHGQGPGIGIRASAQLSQIPYSSDNSLIAEEVFPKGKLDADLQQVDLRKTNSWRLRLGEIQTPEMLEVQLVNAVAPFVLSNRLVPLMRRDFTGQKHIVNVTAMEGKFLRFKQPSRHPHTNMAKAALNMLTHTAAADLARDGIFINAVDTGWVTDEDPAELSELKQKIHDFQPPLDIVDGAARVCDPFFDGILTGAHWCGKFLKDYQPIDW